MLYGQAHDRARKKQNSILGRRQEQAGRCKNSRRAGTEDRTGECYTMWAGIGQGQEGQAGELRQTRQIREDSIERKSGVLKIGFEHHRIRSSASLKLVRKNTYVDEVIQQAVKKKIVPAIERRIGQSWQRWQKTGPFNCSLRNLRNLLPSLKGALVLVWPSFPDGAKLAVVDETGKCLQPRLSIRLQNQLQIEQAKKDLSSPSQGVWRKLLRSVMEPLAVKVRRFVADVLHDHQGPAMSLSMKAELLSQLVIGPSWVPRINRWKTPAISIAVVCKAHWQRWWNRCQVIGVVNTSTMSIRKNWRKVWISVVSLTLSASWS